MGAITDDVDPEKLGRLEVRYHWPVDNPQQAETDWLRLLTPYSGDGKGQLFKPEVGSQVLVDYQGGLAEQPFVLGNLFHAHNKQGAKYSPEQNSMKGIQTAGGNKFVMQDKSGEQSINISNSNNKGTSLNINFNGDGSISTNGPVTVLSPTITLEAGEKGEIKLHAKNITVEAEEEIKVSSATKNIALDAKEAVRFKSKDLKGAFDKELSINAGSKVRISSPDSDVI